MDNVKNVRKHIRDMVVRRGILILRYTVGNYVLLLRSCVAVKLNFRLYIQQYTSRNEIFKYSFPLNVSWKMRRLIFIITIISVKKDSLFPPIYMLIKRCESRFKEQNFSCLSYI